MMVGGAAVGGALPGCDANWRYSAVAWAAATTAGPGSQSDDRVGLDGQLFCVADGVGGSVQGGAAAATAISAVHAFAPFDRSSLEEAFFAANTAVRDLEYRTAASGSTTLTAMLVTEAGAFIGHVGDCRAYLLSLSADDGPTQLTVDDNAAAGRVRDPDDSDYRMLAAQLTKCLGPDPVLEVEAQSLPVLAGVVRVILTSDGVHDWVDLERVPEVRSELDPGRLAAHLVELANQNGTTDDASAVVVDLHAAPVAAGSDVSEDTEEVDASGE